MADSGAGKAGMAKNRSVPGKNFSFGIAETYSGTGKARLAAFAYDYIINET